MAEAKTNPPMQVPSSASKGLVTRVRGVLHGPVLVGVIAALIAIGLSVFGMIHDPFQGTGSQSH